MPEKSVDFEAALPSYAHYKLTELAKLSTFCLFRFFNNDFITNINSFNIIGLYFRQITFSSQPKH